MWVSHKFHFSIKDLLNLVDGTVDGQSSKPCIVPPRTKAWKLKDPTVRKVYETSVNEKCTELFSSKKPVGVDDAWNKVKTYLLNGVDQVCDGTRGGRIQYAETWWWNDDVDKYIKEKRRLWKPWKMGGSKEDYLAAKKSAKRAAYNAKKVAQETRVTEINTEKDCNKIFKLAKNMKVENTDVTGDKCVKDKDNNLVLGIKKNYVSGKPIMSSC